MSSELDRLVIELHDMAREQNDIDIAEVLRDMADQLSFVLALKRKIRISPELTPKLN